MDEKRCPHQCDDVEPFKTDAEAREGFLGYARFKLMKKARGSIYTLLAAGGLGVLACDVDHFQCERQQSCVPMTVFYAGGCAALAYKISSHRQRLRDRLGHLSDEEPESFLAIVEQEYLVAGDRGDTDLQKALHEILMEIWRNSDDARDDF